MFPSYGGGGGFGGGGFGGGGFGGGLAPGGAGSFTQTFKCFPSSFYAAQNHSQVDPQTYENSDRILLPPSAMQMLAQLRIDYPMLFELIPHNGAKHLHCGVLEFVAEEGFVYVPFWMMENMQLEEGDLLTVRNASLDKGSFVKFRPQSKSFIELANPRAVLERTMSKFACLTQNQTVRIFYNNKTYDIDVCELKANNKPAEAVSIIEADINVDFEAPADYVDPVRQQQQAIDVDAPRFTPQGAFSTAAAKGCIAIASSVFLADPAAPTSPSTSGVRLSGKAIKRSKTALSGVGPTAMSQPLVVGPMTVGVCSAPGEHVPLWGASSGDQMALDGAASEDDLSMHPGNTLRKAKVR